MIRKVNGELQTERRELRHAFNDMDMLRTPPRSIDALLRGLTDDRSESMDSNFVDDVMIRALTKLYRLPIYFYLQIMSCGLLFKYTYRHHLDYSRYTTHNFGYRLFTFCLRMESWE